MHPYLRVANVFEDRIDTSDVMSMNFEPPEFARFVLEPGDILLNEGQSKELVGRSAIYRGELPGACFTNSLVRFRANPELTSPEFSQACFKHYLRSGRFQSIAQITTNIAHLGKERFAALKFPLPPVAEQRRIVAKLEALQARADAAKEALDAVPALLERFRQSVLAAAFRGDLTRTWRERNPDVEPASELLARIRAERRRRWQEQNPRKTYVEPEPVDPTDLPELPEGWCWVALEELADVQLGQRKAPEYADKAEFPYIRSANITWDGLDLEDVKTMGFADPDGLQLKKGDVLLNEASGSPSEVGKPAIWNDEIENCCFQATVIRLRPCSSAVDSRWIYYSRLRDAVLAEYAQRCPGLGIIHLTAKLLRRWPVALAPIGEQAVVMSQLENLITTSAGLARYESVIREELTTLHQSILAKAFRGELVPQDPNDEPASVLLERIAQARAETPPTKTKRRARA